MKKIIFLFCLIHFGCVAQNILHGKIIDAETKLPLESATVFISNTTYKTATDENGDFSISIPKGNYQLVISFIGYSPQLANSDTFPDLNKRYTIELHSETENLRAVTVMSPKMRENYIRIFKNNLLGTSKNAEKAKITNIDDVLLNVDDDGNLEVSSDKPLEIENPELNYKLTFILAYFKYDFKNALSHYSGYQSFEDLKPMTENNSKSVNKERNRAYSGSIMHFIRSVYTDTFEAEGFHVKAMIEKANPAYLGDVATKAKYDEARKTKNYWLLNDLPPKVVIEYGKRFLSRKEFLQADNSGRIYFYIPDFLQIMYFREKEEQNYGYRYHKTLEDTQTSQLRAENPKVELYADGNFSNPEGLIFYGYMGWEKLADMLPFNFQAQPEPKNNE